MSRIGKIPVAIPKEVKAAVQNGVVSVEGPKGKLQYQLRRGVDVNVVDGEFVISAKKQNAEEKTFSGNVAADFGTTRAVINNMVQGVTKGWKRSLELVGVGFNAEAQGQKLTLSVGFSHKVVLEAPPIVKVGVRVTAAKAVFVDLESVDREAVGTMAQRIRKVQPPEPYLGKGIRYAEETVRRKAGKTGKK